MNLSIVNFSSYSEGNQDYLGSETVYYAVYVPPEGEISSKDPNMMMVFTDKSEALKMFKLNKKSRLKYFMHLEEAQYFSILGDNHVTTTDSPSVAAEKSTFKCPKSQELVKFRKAIEASDTNTVKKVVLENPRFLVGSGDTPAILQEGFRYNALHVAAKAHAAEVCHYILDTILSVEFFKKLYGINGIDYQDRCEVLLDLYLNMPERGLNETPLHFACKYGALEVVKILLCYPQCDRLHINKHGMAPRDVVCTRAPEEAMINKNEILKALHREYYIPVLRCEDGGIPPIIGLPFTLSSPPISSPKALTPLEVRAVVGPMSKEEADRFRKKWKVSPRVTPEWCKRRPELTDPEKGLEIVGRKLAFEHKVQWKEYWTFLNSFMDITSSEGLDALESYLRKEFKTASEERKAPNMIFTKLNFNRKLNILQRDYEDQLCEAFESINQNDEDTFKNGEKTLKNNINHFSKYALCNGLSSKQTTFRGNNVLSKSKRPHKFFKTEPHKSYSSNAKIMGVNAVRTKNELNIFPVSSQNGNSFPVSSQNGIRTLEKSFEVLAYRVALALVRNQRNLVIQELEFFQWFLQGCVIDERFSKINFAKEHSRFSTLVKEKVFLLTEDRMSTFTLITGMVQSNSKIHEVDKDISNQTWQKPIFCILRNILSYFTQPGVDSLSEKSGSHSTPKTFSCLCSESPKSAKPLFTPRRLFDKEPKNNVLTSVNLTRPSEEFNSSEDDLTDDEYFTAPNSPKDTSDESQDDDMFLSDPGPEVFLTGRHPTKLDEEVLEALEDAIISPSKYPYITMWKQLCRTKLRHLRV